MRRVLLALSLFALAGCPMPQTSAQRLTEAALEMNTAVRFGRMDVALERVGAKAREDFLRSHAGWGTHLRVVDVEFGGFEMVQRDEADVFLDVLWVRSDETTVRTTRIAQRWRDERGHWELVGEARRDGDVGLLGEPEPTEGAPGEAAGASGGGQRPSRSLHTRVIRGD